MRIMTQKRIRHLPVIDKGRLSGIVSIGDVVKNRLDDMELEANVLRDSLIAHQSSKAERLPRNGGGVETLLVTSWKR